MTTILEQELAPLNAQIERVEKQLAALEQQLHAAEADLETFGLDRQRYEALQEVCSALDRLSELEADGLFWDQLAQPDTARQHRERLRERVSGFTGQTRGVQEQQETLQAQIDARNFELDALYDQVQWAYAREQRRQEELVIEREISAVPARTIIMPWNSDSALEKDFRRAMMVALLLFLVIGALIRWVTVPVPERASVAVEIPERLAKLVKEAPKPEPPPKVAEKPPEEPKPTDSTEKKPSKEKPKIAASAAETKAARSKAEGSGVLAFKNTFDELMDETPIAGLGSQANLSKSAGNARPAGSARPSRSLVAVAGRSGSGGISNATVSRNLGSGGKGNADQIGGVGFARVESSMAGLKEEAGRKVSDGPGPARTDEEIQIVFDRYKATLYRIYNKELRKDPTLRGKILLRLTIDPSGAVSSCKVEKTDLASTELVKQIVDRVLKFNFGPKDGVPKTTILYPIDFLPAG